MAQNAPECTPEHLKSQKFPWGSMPPDLPRVNVSRLAMFSNSANIAPPPPPPPRWRKLCTALKWCPYKGRGVISTCVCASNVRHGPASAILHPAKAAAMRTTPYASDSPPPPTPPFLLVQNLSSKWIGPTDNMRTPNG